MGNQPLTNEYVANKLEAAKTHFERTVDCKHTEFDDLYPYMVEHPQFFWYKRYVAWSELLTIVNICQDVEYEWEQHFTSQQTEYVKTRVMSAKVLDHWFETQPNDSREHVG
ncbi:hypothetical protein [Paenibacillus thermotolerans]|uniref:hypothetical protein n=1 Tax=Paenibacillus thermotolerans TaxID=3027807 RepID=UPI00236805D8|nr:MULTISPECIES: hypothetical protein [unclassified Paenibacillus]